jgi:hypothetical protein
MVQLLVHTNIAVQTPALRTVGNVVTGNDLQTQAVLHSGALPYLLSLLSSPKKSIRKEACWTISNITAGNRLQIQQVIQQGIIPPLIQILSTGDFDVKKEAAWAISNATSGGTPEQITYLVAEGCIPPLCALLTVHDNKIVLVALEGLENILKVGAKIENNPYALQVEDCNGLDHIFELQGAVHDGVYQKAISITEQVPIFFPPPSSSHVPDLTPGASSSAAVTSLGSNNSRSSSRSASRSLSRRRSPLARLRPAHRKCPLAATGVRCSKALSGEIQRERPSNRVSESCVGVHGGRAVAERTGGESLAVSTSEYE